MNESLSEPFSAAEDKRAIFGSDVTAAVLRILNDNVLLHKFNYTHVVLIPKCDSPDKSAFIPGRLITNNVLLAFELNHYLKTSTRSQDASVPLKLDMSKAYDRVEWPFLRGVLLRLGFQHRFVHLVMLLVSTISYSLTLNGEQFGYFRPERDIQQVGRNPAYEVYAKASGQIINFQKSSMMVSGCVREGRKQELASILGVTLVSRLDRYLDLPAVGGRSRGALFKYVKDGVWDWLESIAADFWLHNRGNRRIHQVSWYKLCHDLTKRGLGFRCLKEFNLALLAKQGWRILTRPEALISRVIKAKYFEHSTFWEASKGIRSSWTWRSILAARKLLHEGCEYAEPREGDTGGRWERRFHNSGRFTVRSAYRQAVAIRERTVPSSSNEGMNLGDGAGSLWSILWKSRVPPKVKVFMWRLCTESLPTLEKLARRNRYVD
ncbi:UNVERIFIED_CONTAM: putative mitochondrial protein [Sesamum latifolium]|uniref:Mitochondrial protein n=1 Tax=Sesamum latifolium TaxID=2727402 RepID=A0AAW2X4I2_9LAMI